jgi:UDP-glucose 4-epimerase
MEGLCLKVLVTGGAGFIGSHIVPKLIAKNWPVVIVDDLSSGLVTNVHPSARLEKLDITKDDLRPLFAAERFDAVIHLAAQTGVPKSVAAPDFDCAVNILGTVNLLEACRHTGVRRVIFASSAAVYGDADAIPLTESTASQPTSFYGLSKLTAEKYLHLYRELFGLEYIVLRYANVYGERQGDGGEGGVVSIFARRLAAGQPIDIFGDGGQTRDFVYAGDVAEANCQALVTPAANAVYNISTQSETSVSELAALMAKVAGRELILNRQPPREGDIYRSTLANQAAVTKLGWQPATPLLQGLEATYRSLQGARQQH